MWGRRAILIGVAMVAAWALLWSTARSQSPWCFRITATGQFIPVGACTGVGETGMRFYCDPNGEGGVDCGLKHTSIDEIRDVNGDPVFSVAPVEAWRQDATLECAEGDEGEVICGVDSDFTDSHTSSQLNGMGVPTTNEGGEFDADVKFNGTLTGSAGRPLHANGTAGTLGYVRAWEDIDFTLSTGGTKEHSPMSNAVHYTVANKAGAQTLAGAACTVRKLAVTLTDETSLAKSALPSTCTFSIGFDINNSDTTAVCTSADAAADLLCTPNQTVTWADSDYVSVWISSTGAGCGTTDRRVRYAVFCY